LGDLGPVQPYQTGVSLAKIMRGRGHKPREKGAPTSKRLSEKSRLCGVTTTTHRVQRSGGRENRPHLGRRGNHESGLRYKGEATPGHGLIAEGLQRGVHWRGPNTDLTAKGAHTLVIKKAHAV